MKANFSINDIIHIQVVSRLADLLFDPAPENRCTRRTPQRSALKSTAIIADHSRTWL